MVMANVDKIIDILNSKNSVSIRELSKTLGINKNDVQKSAEYLEQDGVVKIVRKFSKTVVTLIKKQQSEMPVPPPKVEEIKKPSQPAPELTAQPLLKETVAQPVQTPQNQPVQPIPVQVVQSTQVQPKSTIQNTSTVQSQPVQQQNIQQPIAQQPIQQPVSQPQPIQQPVSQETGLSEKSTLFQAELSEQPNQQEIPPNDSQTSQEFNNAELQFVHSPDSLQDIDPLNPEKPKFDMIPPIPGTAKKPVFNYSHEYAPKDEINYPNQVKTDAEKLDFLIDGLNEKLNKKNYSDLNIEYRRAFELYENSVNLSQNEKYLLGEKLSEIFDKIKDIYLIQEAV